MADSSTSTVAAFVQAILELLSGLTWPTLVGDDEEVYVFDGITGPNEPSNFIIVGGSQTPAISGTQHWRGLGAQRKLEDYTVSLTISCYVAGDDSQAFDGTNPSTVSDAQMQARNNAFALMAQIETQLRGVGVMLTNVADPPNNIWCELGPKVNVQQTADGDPESDKGRICTIETEIHNVNKIGL